MSANLFWDKIYENALRYPDRVVVRDAKRDWTWQELLGTGAKYARLAEGALASAPINKVIPVFVDRTGNAVAAILGMILSGRPYAPLSVLQPQQRIESCFRSLDADIFIDASGTYTRESNPFKDIVCLPRQDIGLDNTPEFLNVPGLHDTLYVLFTSGSTGEPKGVLANYKNILNTILWSEEIIDWRGDDVIGCATNFFFDISQFDLFSSLYFNISLAIYSNPQNVDTVLEETEHFKITSIFSVPTFFSQLLRCQGHCRASTRSLRRIISGGDFFPPSHILLWMDSRPDIAIYNAWGPTESSIVNTMHRIIEEDRKLLLNGQFVSIGEPNPRMSYVLLDEKEKEVIEPEARGEICMLGDCVTQGYLNNPDETKQAYFSWKDQPAFRTKDIGWFDNKNRLYIFGRKGSTVKISGYRIDLGEVEKAVMMEADIYLARTFVVELQEGIKELWIAVELHNKESEFDIYNFKKGLRQCLPRYMIPKRVIVYNIIPKNTNGKIDRRFLAQKVQNELRRESA